MAAHAVERDVRIRRAARRSRARPSRFPRIAWLSLERTAKPVVAPFVGRDAELRTLVGEFDDAVDERVAAHDDHRLAGLGKTRLARELGARARRRALVVESRCDAGGRRRSLRSPMRCDDAAGIDERPTKPTIARLDRRRPRRTTIRSRAHRRCAAAAARRGRAGIDRRDVLGHPPHRRGRGAAAAARPRPRRSALGRAAAARSRRAPRRVDEDRAVPDRRDRTSGAARDPSRRSTEAGGVAVVISLEGLDDAATERARVRAARHATTSRAICCAAPGVDGGQPALRAGVRPHARRRRRPRRPNGSWVATIDVDAIDVPPTIQSLLAARVERLQPHERTVLELASVIGKEFYRGALASARARRAARRRSTHHLESLRRKELVEPTGTYWIDEPVFRFHHALIRDAAYRRLLKESRAELHERVADWLEHKTAGLLGEHDELVGYHLEQAYESRRQLGPLDDHARELGAARGDAARRRPRGARSTATTCRRRRHSRHARSRVLDATMPSDARGAADRPVRSAARRWATSSTATPAVRELDARRGDSPRLAGVGDVLLRRAREPHRSVAPARDRRARRARGGRARASSATRRARRRRTPFTPGRSRASDASASARRRSIAR